MKTGSEIVDNWQYYEEDIKHLKKRIDYALREAKLEGEIQGLQQATKMVKNSGKRKIQ